MNPDTLQENKTTDSVFQEMNQSYFENQLKRYNQIYIDLRYFKDFKLGTLLLVSQTDKFAYNYIQAQLPLYDRRRVDGDIFLAFPELEKSYRDAYESMIKNKDLHGTMWMMAPNTLLILILESVFETSLKSNIILQERYRPTVIINSYPYELSGMALRLIKTQLQGVCPTPIRFGFSRNPYSEIKVKLFDDSDLVFITDPVEFLKEGTPLHQRIFYDKAYQNKVVISPQRFDPEILKNEVKPDYKLIALDTYQALNLFLNYHYFEPSVLTDVDEKIKYENTPDPRIDEMLKTQSLGLSVKMR